MCTYVIWWSKPYDVMHSMSFKTTATLEALDYVRSGSMYTRGIALGKRRSILDGFDGKFQREWLEYSATSFICLAFSGFHIIGWDFFFATRVEQLLWRISSIACAIIPLCVVVMAITQKPYILNTVPPLFIRLIVVMSYTLVRIYLVIEAFAGLRAVPPAVYDSVNWSNFIPHI
jgi:hypothetical protein